MFQVESNWSNQWETRGKDQTICLLYMKNVCWMKYLYGHVTLDIN